MYNNNNQFDMTAYLQQLGEYVQQQQVEIRELQKSIQLLQTEIKEVKSKPQTNIEKIEYKFDQLKVETLEGTLNIGLNPYNDEQIEEFSVQKSQTNAPQSRVISPEIQESIRDKIMHFLDSDGHKFVQEIQMRMGSTVSESHTQFMIDDVKRQLDNRILYYLDQTKPDQWNSPEKYKETTQQLVDKIKHDIEGAFSAFIQHLPKE